MMTEHIRALENAKTAWEREKSGASWENWLIIGEGLVSGRADAMRSAHTNRPVGRGYNEAFSYVLSKYGLADIDKTDRSSLFIIMEYRGEIESWRQTLTLKERLRLNHPQRVVQKWKATTRTAKAGEKPASAVAKLKEENEALKAKCARLEYEVGDGGNLWEGSAPAAEIAKFLVDQLVQKMPASKAANVMKKMADFMKELKAAPR